MQNSQLNIKCPNSAQPFIKQLNDPYLLSCKDTVCQCCLDQLLLMSGNKKDITCPLCGQKDSEPEKKKDSALIKKLIDNKIPSYVGQIAPEFPNVFYRIKAKHSGKYLQPQNGSQDPMVALVQDENAQQAVFKILKIGENFLILPQNPLQAIQVPGYSVDEKYGVLVQDHFDNRDHQLWSFERQQDNTYFIINKKNKKCMDVDLFKKENGVQVLFYSKKPLEKAANQLFTLEPVVN